MVLCFIALPIFALLGLFSLKYRKLAKESFECLWRTALLKPCKSSLDQRLRSDITGKLIHVSPPIARTFYRYYKLIAFIMLVVFIVSGYFVSVGIYNYVQYGNCNGPNSSAFCIINELAGKPSPATSAQISPLNGSCDNSTVLP